MFPLYSQPMSRSIGLDPHGCWADVGSPSGSRAARVQPPPSFPPKTAAARLERPFLLPPLSLIQPLINTEGSYHFRVGQCRPSGYQPNTTEIYKLVSMAKILRKEAKTFSLKISYTIINFNFICKSFSTVKVHQFCYFTSSKCHVLIWIFFQHSAEF